VFVGEQFENAPEFRLAKSVLLDFFRGRLVEGINLKVGRALCLGGLEVPSCTLLVLLCR